MEHPFVATVVYDDSECQVRRTFWKREHAVIAQQKIKERTGKLRKIESKCRYCGGYHLGA